MVSPYASAYGESKDIVRTEKVPVACFESVPLLGEDLIPG
jgi:hypothetical protein